MDINLTLAGQIVLINGIAVVACTVWYARRPSFHTVASSLLLAFAWLIPVIGALCFAVFLAAMEKSHRKHSAA